MLQMIRCSYAKSKIIREHSAIAFSEDVWANHAIRTHFEPVQVADSMSTRRKAFIR